jgi:hypothetical protein
MAYVIHDDIDTWPETVRAGKAAMGLYFCCGVWIARMIWNGAITEPVVPSEIAAMYGTPEWVAKLVAVGFWSAEGAGYLDVKYHALGNKTAEQVAAARRAEADRKARWREKQAMSHRDKTRDTRGTRRGTDVGSPSFQTPPKGGMGARPRDATQSTRFSDGDPIPPDPYADRQRSSPPPEAAALLAALKPARNGHAPPPRRDALAELRALTEPAPPAEPAAS